MVERLRLHGVEFARLQNPVRRKVQTFSVEDAALRRGQGHNELVVDGVWRDGELELPAGTVLVSGRQRLARLAAQLLEPFSEDSLTVWNFFDQVVEGTRHPVVRVVE